MAKFTFDFSISYAGEDAKIAESLAHLLTQYGAYVYCAHFFQTQLVGRKMSEEFGLVFGPQTRFFVPIISQWYTWKTYPQYEWQIALNEAQKSNKEYPSAPPR